MGVARLGGWAHSVGVARLGGLGMAGHVVIVCRGGGGMTWVREQD